MSRSENNKKPSLRQVAKSVLGAAIGVQNNTPTVIFSRRSGVYIIVDWSLRLFLSQR